MYSFEKEMHIFQCYIKSKTFLKRIPFIAGLLISVLCNSHSLANMVANGSFYPLMLLCGKHKTFSNHLDGAISIFNFLFFQRLFMACGRYAKFFALCELFTTDDLSRSLAARYHGERITNH